MSNTLSSQIASLNLRIASSRKELGREAASDIAADLLARLQQQDHIRIIFAAAPSQSEMLQELIQQSGIDWSRISAFHMDEYIGLPEGSPQRFGEWLRAAIFDRVPFAATHRIAPGKDLPLTCSSYARLLAEKPIDLVLLGIGDNGHLAFNDPPADLQDPDLVRTVELDLPCRQQQVDDGCFARLEDVPTHAITLTVPVLLNAKRLFCCVPGARKANAARRMMHDPISGACPATALRLHAHCTVYLDQDSAAELD